MGRKRTNLDTTEAEYLYANVLVEFNKYDSFEGLSIPERNDLIDKVCTDVIKEACKNKEHVEAVTQEILAYKLSKEEEERFYSPEVYTSGVEKQENFEKILGNRYQEKIVEFVLILSGRIK